MQTQDYEDSNSKIEGFLKAVGRNSESTRNTYTHALKHFRNFLDNKYGYPTTIGNIIDKIQAKDIDVYPLLDGFISYLTSLPKKIANASITMYVAAVKSYLQFYDIDIIPHKFKHRVRIPKGYREEEQAIDHEDIRKILKACNNPRLKAYIYVLASGGMRTIEALATRIKDIDFSVSPTKVHLRKEYTKTRTPRHTYISDEATNELRRWIEYKYSTRRIGTKMVKPEKSDDHLIFTKEVNESIKPTALYPKINQAFHQVLRAVNLDQIKEGSNSNRRKIVPNSFRHFVYTTVGDQTSTDYANWLLGHANSTYWSKKEDERKEIYQTKCMKALTFLDFSGLVTRSKNIETQVQVLTEANRKQENEIEDLRQLAHDRATEIEYLEQGERERVEQILKIDAKLKKMNAQLKQNTHNAQIIYDYINSALESGVGLDVTHVPKQVIDKFKRTLSKEDRKKFEERIK